jgi:hypothetical protein
VENLGVPAGFDEVDDALLRKKKKRTCHRMKISHAAIDIRFTVAPPFFFLFSIILLNLHELPNLITLSQSC